jgi:MFS family permease
VLIVTQILDGITGAALGVMTPLVIADVTKGTGRFNLAQGTFGAIMGVGASLSPTLTGLIVDRFGPSAGFVSLAAVGWWRFWLLRSFCRRRSRTGKETNKDLPPEIFEHWP